MKSPLIRKHPDAGKDKRREEKGMTEDEMVGCHHQLNGHGFEQTLGDSEGQGSVLQSTGSQSIRQDSVAAQQQEEFAGVKIKVKNPGE